MPTYTNISNEFVDVDGYLFKSGEQKITQKFINDARIRLDSIEPYYQPVFYDTTISASPSGTPIEIDKAGCELIFSLISGTSVEVFFNSLDNVPPFICFASRTFTFRNEGQITQIYVKGSGTLNVKNVKNKLFRIDM